MNNQFLISRNGKGFTPLLSFPVLIFIFLISISFISAAPPVTTVQQIAEGYIISDSPNTHLKQNTDFQYNFFVYNITNGALKINTSVTCIHYIADSQGNVIFYGAVPYKPEGYWGIKIAGGNFSNLGYYAYGTRCNSTALAGATVGLWEVTSSGQEANPNFYYILLLLALGIIVLGLSIKNAPLTILGSFGLVYIGLYVILYGINGVKDNVYTWAFGIITIAVAGYIGVKSAMEMMEDK